MVKLSFSLGSNVINWTDLITGIENLFSIFCKIFILYSWQDIVSIPKILFLLLVLMGHWCLKSIFNWLWLFILLINLLFGGSSKMHFSECFSDFITFSSIIHCWISCDILKCKYASHDLSSCKLHFIAAHSCSKTLCWRHCTLHKGRKHASARCVPDLMRKEDNHKIANTKHNFRVQLSIDTSYNSCCQQKYNCIKSLIFFFFLSLWTAAAKAFCSWTKRHFPEAYSMLLAFLSPEEINSGRSRILVRGAQKSFDPRRPWAKKLLIIAWKLDNFDKNLGGKGGQGPQSLPWIR